MGFARKFFRNHLQVANFEKIKKKIGEMDDAILVEGSAANDEAITEAIETNIKTNNEELKSSEVVDSTKNGSTEPNLKNEVSTGIFLTKLESSEEPTSVVDSNKTESNTEADRQNPNLSKVEENEKGLDGVPKEDGESERIKSLFPEDFYQKLAWM